MDDEITPEARQAALDWYNHVKKNKENLTRAFNEYGTEDRLLYTRNLMAELGHECTPDNLREFLYLLQETLTMINEEEEEDGIW